MLLPRLASCVLEIAYASDMSTNGTQIFNLQRLAVLTTALTRSPPDAELIFQAMQDKVHQPYRKTLVCILCAEINILHQMLIFGQIPGLPDVLASVTPQSHPGLLGICLSGAGPTILALATHNFDHIAEEILKKFDKENIECDWKVLEPAYDGATITLTSD